MRFKKLIAVAAVALGSLSLGSAALAAKGHANPKAGVETSSVDTDTLQIGDQTSPDVGQLVKANGDTTQQGDQSTPDGTGSTESSGSESGSTEAESPENAPSDGPGGWADPPGNVDNQFEGAQ